MRFTAAGAAVVGVCAVSFGPAHAQEAWQPTEPVEFVVPYGVGGGADVFARIMAQVMTEEDLVPVPVQVVNHPGGGSAVGLAYVLSNRTGNPHTLALVNNPTQVNPMVVDGAPGLKDVQPIYNFMLDDFIMVVRDEAPWQSAADLAAAAKEMPPQSISVGLGGPVGGDVMGSRAFTDTVGIEFNEITFNGGGEVLTALLGGHVDVAVANPIEYLGQIDAGAVRAIGTFRSERYPDLPDVPTMSEQGIDARAVQIWRGVAVPQDIPEEAVAYWVGIMDQVAASPAVQDYLKANMATEASMKGEELLTFLAEQEAVYRDMLSR